MDKTIEGNNMINNIFRRYGNKNDSDFENEVNLDKTIVHGFKNEFKEKKTGVFSNKYKAISMGSAFQENVENAGFDKIQTYRGYDFFVTKKKKHIAIGIECSNAEAKLMIAALGDKRVKTYSHYFFKGGDFVEPKEGKALIVISQDDIEEDSDLELVLKAETIRAQLNIDLFASEKKFTSLLEDFLNRC